MNYVIRSFNKINVSAIFLFGNLNPVHLLAVKKQTYVCLQYSQAHNMCEK